MYWAKTSALVTDTVVGAFGEPIGLPCGVVSGIFSLRGQPVESRTRGRSTGARLVIDQQAPAELKLRTEDAAGLRQQDPVVIRGVEYLVVRLDPDGAGMTAIELMRPGDAAHLQPQNGSPWR